MEEEEEEEGKKLVDLLYIYVTYLMVKTARVELSQLLNWKRHHQQT